MVNVRAIANRLTRGINPNITAQLRVSNGYATLPSGKQTPAYSNPVDVTIQAQSLTKKDLDHLAGLNISGVDRAVYCDTQLTGADRHSQSGGDLLTFEGRDWLVTAVLEGWTGVGWCKVALTGQK